LGKIRSDISSNAMRFPCNANTVIKRCNLETSNSTTRTSAPSLQGRNPLPSMVKGAVAQRSLELHRIDLMGKLKKRRRKVSFPYLKSRDSLWNRKKTTKASRLRARE
jgi:hypothetical protein